MIDLTDMDKRILEEVQQDFPMTARPFREIGKRIGIPENEIISRILYLKKKNIIRDISAIFNAEALGYKSTLVAVRSDDPEITAGRINNHPGVSHNYLRKHMYNLWFTITIRKKIDFKTEIENLLGPEVRNFLILPSLRTFKIGVNFTFSDKKRECAIRITEKPANRVIDEKLIILLQQEFPLVSNPWKDIANRAGMDEDNLILEIKELKNAGVLKRISAVLRHRNAGFTANGMVCFKVFEERIEDAGRTAARFSEVSHCYQRPVFPDWQYNFFAMTHGRSKEQCESVIRRMAEEINADEYFTLYSIKEFKKERVRYFMEEDHVQQI